MRTLPFQTKDRVRFRTVAGTILFLCISLGLAHAQGGARLLGEKIDRFVLSAVDSRYAASVLVTVDGRVILQRGYGWTDVARSSQATPQTLFNVASITKSFTAISVFLLKDSGRLRLEDTLPVFFGDVPMDKLSVTVRQLLLHTSGLPQSYASDGITDRGSAVRAILKDRLLSAPGAAFSYSNENYELLAAIIEVVSGRRYEDFVRRNVLATAKMNRTKFWGEASRLGSPPTARKDRELEPAILERNWGYLGSGGLFTSVSDLRRWFAALEGGRILRPESLSGMWQPQVELSATSVAYGWFVSSRGTGPEEIWTRGTEDWGHNGVLRWFPERKVLIIVLTNSGEMGDKNVTGNRLISDGIAKLIFDEVR
jgi:CubicO group peptidase (beta-lactamase class C family)